MDEARAEDHSSLQGLQAFEDWFAQACKEGNPPDRLRIHSPNEAERFWARTVPGPDGHVFWTGGGHFTRNAGQKPRVIRPARWVWVRNHGPIPSTDAVTPTCGEPNCVTLEHLKCERREGLASYIPEERLLGRLQVVAMELGRTPSTTEWAARGEHPVDAVYVKRFGSWARAVAAAGLAAVVPKWTLLAVSPEQAAASLRRAALELGHAPTRDEYREWAKAHVDEVGSDTVKKRLGGRDWPETLRKAGVA